MAFDAYLYFSTATGIFGESTSEIAKKPPADCNRGIEIEDFSPMSIELPIAENRSANTAAVAGRAQFEKFSCKKKLDTATVPLLIACMKGVNIPFIQCDIYRNEGGKSIPYISLRYENCVIVESSYEASGDELPSESLSFTYSSQSYAYQQFDDQGKPVGQWSGNVGFQWSTRTNKGAKAPGMPHKLPVLK